MAQELNVNIVPQSYLPEIRVSQNDNTLRTIKVKIVNEDGSPYEIPAEATATFAGTKPSGLGFTAACTIEESAVTFAVSDTMSNEVGRFPAEIRFMDGEDRIGTCNVLMRVEPNPHPDDTTDGDREPLVNEITALLQQITEQADRVEEYSGKVLNMTVTAHASDEATVTKTEGEVVNLDFGLPRGPQGPQGIPGEDGEDGVTPEFSIGTVETLAPGERATATITGTDEDPVLNLGIPQGAKGDKGDTGEVSMDDFLKVAVTDEASGSGIVTFPDGANLPAKSLKLTLTPKQDATPWIGTDHDTAPYLHRAMPSQSNDYNRESGVIVGGTVGWNQLVASVTESRTAIGLTFTNNGNGSVTITGTSSSASAFRLQADTNPIPTVDNHVYFVSVGGELPAGVSIYLGRINGLGSQSEYIRKPNVSSGLADSYFGLAQNASGKEFNATYTPQLIDLTAMFGTTIADYIYSLEQSSAGAGVAWFRKYFPEDYYPYSANTLQSVQATAHKTYDSGGNVIGNYALDSSLTLRGIPKLDASNNLYYDGDTYESDGTVTKKYGIVDLGTLNWSKDVSGGNVGFYANAFSGAKPPSSWGVTFNAISKYFVTVPATGYSQYTVDKTIFMKPNGQMFAVDNAYTDAATFKSAMSGVYLVYELATPTTETAQAYTNPQIVDPDGTEEYVTANSVPVGHDSTYSLVCPISGYDEVSAVVSPTTTASDGQTYTADLPQTVYGGTVDLVSGELTIEWAKRILDGSEEGWQLNGSLSNPLRTYCYNRNASAMGEILTTTAIMSDSIPSQRFSGNNEIIGIYVDGGYLWIRTPPMQGMTATAEWKAYLVQNPLEVVYKLSTPQTIQLTPQEIRTLLGTNNVWGDGSNTYIKYIADTRLFILKVLANA